MYQIGQYVRIIDKSIPYYNKIAKIINKSSIYYDLQFINDVKVGGFLNKDFIPYIPFKVGDTVQIIPHLEIRSPGGYYESPTAEIGICSKMLEQANKIFVLKSENIGPYHLIKLIINGQCWFWSPDLLIPIKTLNQLNIF